MNTAHRLRPADPSVSPPFRRRRDLAARTTRAGRPGDRHRAGRRAVRSRHQLPHRRARRPGRGARGLAHHPPGASDQPHRAIRPVRGRRCRRRRDQCDGPAASLDAIEAFFRELHALGTTPITIGGDHTVPLPILRVIARQQPVGVVQFDAHPDTLDTLMGTRINHATTFRRAVEEGLIDPRAHGAGRPARQPVQRRRCGLGTRGRHARHHHGRVRGSLDVRASSRRSAASSATARPMSASTSMASTRRTRWAPACPRWVATRCATHR